MAFTPFTLAFCVFTFSGMPPFVFKHAMKIKFVVVILALLHAIMQMTLCWQKARKWSFVECEVPAHRFHSLTPNISASPGVQIMIFMWSVFASDVSALSVFAEPSGHIHCFCWLLGTHLNLSSLVSSFWVCSSSCRLLTCSSFTSWISALMHWSLAYSYEERERERGREREGERSKQSGWGGEMSPGAVCSLMNWSPAHWGLVAHSNSTGGTGVGRKGQPIGAWQHSSPPSLRFIPPLSSCAPELPHCSFFDCPGSKQVG